MIFRGYKVYLILLKIKFYFYSVDKVIFATMWGCYFISPKTALKKESSENLRLRI
jgi:hypothetical protein